jgi:hypothetical protein
MNYGKLLSFLVICSLCVVSLATAENNTGGDKKSVSAWNGTWSNPDYLMYITQNQSGIAGEYVPTDLNALDPGRLEGNVSDDGKTFSGIWIETGSNTYILSDDKMSFTITGFADPYGSMSEPAGYSYNATRIGEIMDPKNPWTGNWVTEKKSYNLTQNGSQLSGVNEPLTNVNDEVGSLSGTISENGTVYTGNWTEKGRFTFVMADDGLSYNATITKSLDPNGFVEHMVFTK